ncbi:MAG: ATP-binding protein [Planctomycetota bacterium]
MNELLLFHLPRSASDLRALSAVEALPAGAFSVRAVDVEAEPALAAAHGVRVTPALVRVNPAQPPLHSPGRPERRGCAARAPDLGAGARAGPGPGAAGAARGGQRPALLLDPAGAALAQNAAARGLLGAGLRVLAPLAGATCEVQTLQLGADPRWLQGELACAAITLGAASARLAILPDPRQASDSEDVFVADLRRQLRAESPAAELDKASTRRFVRGEVAYLRAMIDGIEDPIFLKDVGGRFVVANDATARTVGCARAEQIRGKSVGELLPRPEVAEEIQALEDEIVRTGVPTTYRFVHAAPDEAPRTYLITKSLYRDAEGQPAGVIGLSRDVTDLDRVQAELTRANEELADANYDLASFATVAGHDLRAPLRGVGNLAGFLLEDLPDLPQEATEELRTIQRLAARADRMILDLLEFSRTGRVEVRLKETRVGELVEHVCDSHYEALGEAEIRVEIAPDLPQLRLWRTGLYQVFDHLLKNALAHAQTSDSVEIGWEAVEDGYRFSVRDHGPGIDPALEPTIFEPFSRTRTPGGSKTSGLGLAVVRRTLRRMGGRVWHEPTPGGGSTFVFELPREAPAPPEPA